MIDSIVSVSVDPDPSGLTNPCQFQLKTSPTFPFGAPNNIILPRGTINVKVQRDRQQRAPERHGPVRYPTFPSTSAFFASHVNTEKGPAVPPDVPQAPYRHPWSITPGNGS